MTTRDQTSYLQITTLDQSFHHVVIIKHNDASLLPQQSKPRNIAYNVKNDKQQIETRQQRVLKSDVLHRRLVLVVLQHTTRKHHYCVTRFYYISCMQCFDFGNNDKHEIMISLAVNFLTMLAD